MENKKAKLFRLTVLGLFIAIILIMDFTPLGYITTGGFSITLMTIPVAVGAVCFGPVVGAVLGGMFGLTSFLQCFGIGYFIDPSGAVLLNISPLATVITCFVPRIIAGLLPALLFGAFSKAGKTGLVPIAVSTAAVPVLNTLLFMLCYIVLFKNTALSGVTVMSVIIAMLTLNLLIEFSVTLVAGSAINRALYKFTRRLY